MDDRAFQDCTYVQALTISGAVRRIGTAAFANTASIREVSFNEGLLEIGPAAFSNAWRMLSVSIPVSVTNVGTDAFWNCKNLVSVTTPTHIKPLMELFPAVYDRLSEVSIAIGETMLVPYVFDGCAALEAVALPNTVDNIPEAAFRGCRALGQIDLPCIVTNVGREAFKDCTSISRVAFPENLRTLGVSACEGMVSLTRVEFPSGLTEVAQGAFTGCTQLARVEIPTLVDWLTISFADAEANPLTQGAMLYVEGIPLERLVIPDGTTRLGNYVLTGYTNLTTVVFPESLVEIGTGAFTGCSCVRSATLRGDTLSLADLFPDSYWTLTDVVVRPGTEQLVESFFTGCTNLSSVVLPASLDFREVAVGGGVEITGNTNWSETGAKLDGKKIYQSNAIRGSQSTALTFRVPAGMRKIVFSWKVDSESNYDWLTYYVDGVQQSRISGQTMWNTITNQLDGAEHTLKFVYSKDGSISSGSDCGWISFLTGDGTGMFSGCSSIQSVVVRGDGVPLSELFPDAYQKLTGVTVQPGTAHLVSGFFDGCTSITHVTLPEKLEDLDSGMFTDCCNLERINLPEPPTGLGDNDFRTIGKLAIGKADGFWIQDGWVLGYLGTAPEVVEVPVGVKGIAPYAFADQYDLVSVTFPGSLEYIGVNAFRRCTNLERIELPEGVVRVDDRAFQDCTYIQELVLPTTLRKIGSAAFANTASLDGVSFVDGLVEIGSAAFSNAWRMLSVSIPISVTNVGVDAFWNCKNLVDVTTPSNLKSLSELFPAAYDRLESISVAVGETVLRPGVFAGCSALRTLTIPDSVTDIGTRALAGCANVAELVFPEGLRVLGTHACDGMAALTEVVVPDGVTEIGEGAFANCHAVRRVTIPGDVVSVQTVFPDSLAAIESVTVIPGTVELVPDFLKDCTALSTLVIPDSVVEIGARAFAECTALTEVDMPTGVTELGTGVFQNCTGLVKVSLPDELLELPDEAFAGCNMLSSLVVPARVAWVGTRVFSDCTTLRRVLFLGNAPDVASDAYEGVSAELVTYVVAGTRGWDGLATSKVLPETWPLGTSNTIMTWPSVPGVIGDADATVTGNAENGFIVRPSRGTKTVEVVIPVGFDPEKVTVEVDVLTDTVMSHGATIRLLCAGHDITPWVDIPTAGTDGVTRLDSVEVKESVAQEILLAAEGASFTMDNGSPCLVTAPTKPGLVYTVHEGPTLDAMVDGASTVGDGLPWIPSLTAWRDGGFYTIRVGTGRQSE